jgi:hypothetical protein
MRSMRRHWERRVRFPLLSTLLSFRLPPVRSLLQSCLSKSDSHLTAYRVSPPTARSQLTRRSRDKEQPRRRRRLILPPLPRSLLPISTLALSSTSVPTVICFSTAVHTTAVPIPHSQFFRRNEYQLSLVLFRHTRRPVLKDSPYGGSLSALSLLRLVWSSNPCEKRWSQSIATEQSFSSLPSHESDGVNFSRAKASREQNRELISLRATSASRYLHRYLVHFWPSQNRPSDSQSAHSSWGAPLSHCTLRWPPRAAT